MVTHQNKLFESEESVQAAQLILQPAIMPSAPLSSQPLPPFTHHPSLSAFTVSPPTYIASYSASQYEYLATGAIVLETHSTSAPRILLMQRAASDSSPNKWETPGGGCDDEDTSVLHAVARELWEEAGLVAVHVASRIGEPQFFLNRSGKRICKMYFVVEVSMEGEGVPQVRLCPEEHQSFVWASEGEVAAGSVGETVIDFTSREQEDVVRLAFAGLKDS